MMVKLMIRIYFRTVAPCLNRVAVARLAFGMDDRVPRKNTILRSTDFPKRGGYPRATTRKKDRYAQSQKTANLTILS